VLVVNLSYAFWSVRLINGYHQEQKREGGKAHSEQYMAGWARLLHLVLEPTSLAVRLCRRVRRAPLGVDYNIPQRRVREW